MASGYFLRPKGRELLKLSKKEQTPYGVSFDARLAVGTVNNYIGNNADTTKRVDLDSLPAIFIDGMGLSPEEFLDLRLGDIFDLLQEESATQ